ncbi:MAG TPA: hypothetical protein VNL98_00410 [Gemmatimonadales bacterium]|nr:hypothetical protein [Gemmatimonadales bacterium]
MRVLAHATSPAMLGAINDLIHDRWFEIDGTVFDESARTVRIPFDPIARSAASGAVLTPETIQILEVRRARVLNVHDSERVSRYDFDRIEWDGNANAVLVRTGVPVSIRVEVDEVDVMVLEPSALTPP